ncbi:zinc finger protein 3 homolog [Musca vetustissima]|uniref:zinc finger protein 3 homolog n=1 Tax=Musca vetustissima TaxID=27455 RepID=UPI002AB5FBB5|nr:zinc finger protein 3 homolog [Musca vetustissima]
MIYLCRLCASLKKPDHLITINDETNDICQKAKECCQVHIRMQDLKPKQVCQECVESLNDYYKFYIKVKEAQEALETIYPTPEEDKGKNGEVATNKEKVTDEVAQPVEIGTQADDEDNLLQELESPENSSPKRTKAQAVRRERDRVKPATKRNPTNTKIRKIVNKESIKVKQERTSDNEIPAPRHPSAIKRQTEVIVTNEADEDDNDNDGYLEEVYTILNMGKGSNSDGDDGYDEMQLQEERECNENIHKGEPNDQSYMGDETSEYYEVEDQVNNTKLSGTNEGEYHEEDTVNDEQIYLEESNANEYDMEEVEEEDVGNENYEVAEDSSTLPPHLQLSHWTSYPFLCSSCDYKAVTPMDLFNHANSTHSIENLQDLQYKCYDCKQLINHYVTFLNHIRFEHHPALKLKCDACDIACKDYVHYANHRSRDCTQLAQYPEVVPCKQCFRNFDSNTSLQAHTRQYHSGAGKKPKYKCQYCSKEYTWRRSLLNHEMSHGYKREFACTICGKKFFSKIHLESHIFTHNSEKPFECDICHKNFKTATIMERHKIVHTDKKPFACQFCPKTFRTRMESITHERVHTGETPLECKFCEKRFRFRSALSAHLKVHLGIKEHACQHCPKTFTDISNFYKHIRRKHADV